MTRGTLLLFVTLLAPCAALQAAPAGEDTVAVDEAVVELALPPGATARAEGRDANSQRLRFTNLPPGVLQAKTIDVRFRNGTTASREVLVQGGWLVRLPVLDPNFARPGFESKPAPVSQTGHSRPLTSLAFSPDGQLVLTGSRDHTAILWDARSGERIRSFEAGEEILGVAFSPDGKRVYAVSIPRGLHVWETNSGQSLPAPYSPNNRGGARSNISPEIVLATSGNGRVLLMGSQYPGPRAAQIVDLNAPQGFKMIPLGDNRSSNEVTAAALSHDGQLAVLCQNNGSVRFLDTRTGRETRTLKVPQYAEALAVSPDGRHLLVGSHRNIGLWDVQSGERVRSFQGHTSSVTSLAFSPDGKHVLSGSLDHTARLWDAADGRLLQTFSLRKDLPANPILRRPIGTVAVFSPDGQWVLTGQSGDQTANLWDASTGKPLRAFQGLRVGQGSNPNPGEKNVLPKVAFSTAGARLLTSFGTERAVLWDLIRGTAPRSLKGSTREVSTLAFSPDGKWAFLGARWGAELWSLETGEHRGVPQATATVNKRTVVPVGWAYTVAFSHDSTQIAFGAETDGSVRIASVQALWNRGRQPYRTFSALVKSTVEALAFSPDGKQLVTGSHYGNVQVWGLGRGYLVRDLGKEFGAVTTVGFSPDGKQVLALFGAASVVTPAHLSLWDTASGELRREFQSSLRSGVVTAAFSPDGKQVLVGMQDGSVVLHDATTAKPLRTWEGHTTAVQSVAYRQDGRQVVSASLDGTIRLWDVATGDELLRLFTFDGSTDWAVVTPEGLFDGSRGGRERVTFRIGKELSVVPLDRFFQDTYYPGLLPEIGRGERPFPGKPQETSPAPLVRILVNAASGDAKDRVAVDVAVTDQGGGISGPWLQHKGATIRSSEPIRKQGKTWHQRFLVSLVPGDNRLEARAATADGARESEPAVHSIRFDGTLPDPELHVISVGLNRYAPGAGVANLDFCVPDARSMADLFRRRSSKLFRQVHVTELFDDQATKDRILRAVADCSKRARAQDTLILFVASHGLTVGQRFYLIPHDFKLGTGEGPAEPARTTSAVVSLRGFRGALDERETAVRSRGLAIDELGEALAAVPALKRVLIFDTCHSGSAVALAGKKRNPFGFQGAMERLSRAQGVYSLSATAADELAAETKELGHSILTYALLAGMKAVEGGPLAGKAIAAGPSEGPIDVLRWLGYARAQVPGLYEKYVGRPQHVELNGDDQPTFPLLSQEPR